MPLLTCSGVAVLFITTTTTRSSVTSNGTGKAYSYDMGHLRAILLVIVCGTGTWYQVPVTTVKS